MNPSHLHDPGPLQAAAPEDPASRPPACSVVICTRNRPVELERCLTAVSRLAYPSFDVLVVDNAPTDGLTHEVAERWRVRYVVEPLPGLSRARNRGARACDSDVVAFLDDDAVPELDWLACLAREFRDPMVMAVAGRRLPLVTHTEAEKLCTWMHDKHQRFVVDRLFPQWFEIVNFGGIGTGMNMAFRRRAFDLWPGFHERLGRGTALRGGEEHHAFFSLVDRGFKVVHSPDAVVRHPFPATMPALREKQTKDLASATGYVTLLFVEEHRHRWAVLKYVLEGLRGKRRTWRTQTKPGVRLVPWWRVPLARLAGPALYAWSRLTERRFDTNPSGSAGTDFAIRSANPDNVTYCSKDVVRSYGRSLPPVLCASHPSA
jgi:glycosyltransferase involved in cell wall biosynthesis